MLESKFQASLIKELREKFDGCLVLKNDPNHLQGMPDLTVLHNNQWAVLECKRDAKSSYQPNQEHYLHKLNGMSFARVIYPENKEAVLNELQQSFQARR